MRARWRVLAALAGASLACSTTAVVNTTNNVLRATDVAFVCLDVQADPLGLVRPLPLSRCGLNSDNSSATGSARLHALMIQQTRGELAVVDLAATSGTALLDNSPSSPGFSFQPTLALPTALAVDVRGDGDPNAAAPPVVWVASASAHKIQRIDARGLRKDPTVAAPLLTGSFDVDGAPRDLAIDSVAGRRVLYASLPDRGAIAVYDVTDPSNVTPLGAVTLNPGAAQGDGGVAARPSTLALDPRTHRLYVGDDGAAVVHALEGFPLREVATIPFGVRTRSLALTGWARAGRAGCSASADPDHCGFAQYLYGVSTEDGSVHVWDLARGAAVRPNRMPSPNPLGRRLDPTQPEDRVALPAPAMALVAMNTPEYDEVTDPLDPSRAIVNAAVPCEAGPCTSGVTPAPTVLRGAFVGALLRTGELAIIDLDDYDAACREVSCGTNGATTRTPYRHIRHAPRASVALTEAPKVSALPVFAAPVQGGGQNAPVTEASISPVIACEATRTRGRAQSCAEGSSFGVELTHTDVDAASGGSRARVVDAYLARNEAWTFTWEGVIPGLDQAGGALSAADGMIRLDAPGAVFCVRGALAQAEARDTVTLVGETAPLARDRARCADLFGSGALPLNREFVVESAYQDHLVLRPTAAATPELVAQCFPQATRFQVRASGQWVATGNRSGFLHAVRAGAEGRCELDPERVATFDGYASRCVDARFASSTAARCPPGRGCNGAVSASGEVSAVSTPVFANPFFCLQLFPAIAQPSPGRFVAEQIARDATIAFAIGGAYEPLLSNDAGNLPLSARYLPSIGRLYVVDTSVSGLIEYRANPLGRTGRVFN